MKEPVIIEERSKETSETQISSNSLSYNEKLNGNISDTNSSINNY